MGQIVMQISLFADSAQAPAKTANSSAQKPSAKGKETPKAESVRSQAALHKPKPTPKRIMKPIDQCAPYGVCHRCARAFQTPGLDRSYCKACGWVGGQS